MLVTIALVLLPYLPVSFTVLFLVLAIFIGFSDMDSESRAGCAGCLGIMLLGLGLPIALGWALISSL